MRGNRNVTFRVEPCLRLQMRLVLPILFVCSASAQVCAPGRISPVGVISGALDDSSCFLSDSTAYVSYRLDLPVRGRVQITLSTSGNFHLLLRDSSGVKIDSGASIRRPLEAGAYTLLVNARVPGQVGQFTVRTAFTAEAGILCKAFPSVGLTQKVDATLGAAGCALPDGSLYDGWRLTTFGAGTLTVTVAADWSPLVFIRTPDGAAVASGESTVTTVVDRDTQYLVVVSTADRAGPYQVSTSFTPAETETCRPVKIDGPAVDAGVITPDSCATVLPASGDLLYYNVYAVSVVAAAGVADFIATSSDFAVTLELIDERGAVLATDAGGADSGGAQIRTRLRPGSYYARIVSSDPAGGRYLFTHALASAAPIPCATVPLDLSAPKSASLTAASCRTEIGLADLYTVTLPAAGALDLSLSRISPLNPIAAIRDAKDNLLVFSRDMQDLGLARLSADLPAGDYTVLAAAGFGAGFYELTAAFTTRALPPCPAPQTLDINGGYVQRLGANSCRGANGAPVDYYEFTLPSESVTAMVMTSSDLDGYLTLTDPDGAVLRSDDNSYGYGDPLVIQHLPAGTYRLAARPAAGTTGGLYQVDVRTIPAPRPPFCSTAATIPIGGTASGVIDFSDCQYTDDTFADIYKIELQESATLEIRLSSTAFDAYLLLLDAKGNLIDRDDDGAGNRDARLVPSLLPGAYYIVAKPVESYTAAGAYTLSVQ